MSLRSIHVVGTDMHTDDFITVIIVNFKFFSAEPNTNFFMGVLSGNTVAMSSITVKSDAMSLINCQYSPIRSFILLWWQRLKKMLFVGKESVKTRTG